jgi:hypothetical protein
MTKNPDTVGTSLNQKVLSNRLSQLSAVNAIDAAVVTETRRQAELINNKMHALRKASLPEIARKLQFYSPEPGVILCNAEATALFNLAHFGHIEASGLTATNTPSKPFARVYAELDNLARSLYKDGEIDAANNVWAFAQLHSQAERSSEFRDVVLAIFDPEAPVYCQHTLQEEMEHRDDVRTRRVLVDIDGINYLQLQQTPSMKLTPSLHMIPPPKNWMRLKIFQGALNTMKSGPYRNKTTGQWYAEIIAKSLRYDGELELNITPKERIAIVKYYVKHIIREQIRPEDLMVLRTHNSGRSRELQEIYAKEYERKYPNAAQRAGVGKSAVADDSLRKIWREWVGENVPATPIPAQYVAQVSVSQAKGKPQTVITTPKLPQRLTMRIIRDDGQYLQTPNNPEVKLSEEDIQAIQSSNDVDRVWMEDAIYAANISKRSLSSDKYNLDLTPLPNKFDFAKDFADLPKMSSLLPTSKISPSTAFKEGAKLSWGIWKSKTALRASADLSALRQGARLWSSQKLFFKELNEEGRQAVAINQQLDKDIAKWTRMIAKAKEDLATGTPLEWEIKAQKGITRAGVERAIERWQRSAEDAEARKIKITRAMRDIRISTLLGHQLGAIHLGAKAENWTGNITTRLGQFPGAKYLKGKTGGVIPGMRWYAETTWNHPNYKFFKNELGLDFGGLVKPEVGFEVANGFNTGKVFIKEYAIRPVGSGANMVPDLKVLNQIRKNNPEREVTVTYDAKQKIFIASVERVKIDNQDKDVPMTFDWRTYGEGTTQLSEIFGKGIFSRVPFINSKYGKRTMKRALASKDWQNIAGWVANRARQKNPVTAVIQMSENSYGTSLGWLRFKAMQERLKDLTVSFAMEGKSTDLQSPEFLDALREAARFINMASGSYKAKSDTKVGKFVENFVRPALSKILFSFNFTASAPGFWNPRTLLNAPKYVRASMVQGWIQRAAFLGTMLSLLNYFTDAEFTYDDPSDMGFLKLKIGPKTVDITSGDSKFLIAMARTAQLFGDWAFPPKKGLYDTKKDSTLLDVLSNTMRLWTRYFLLSANPQVQDIYAGLANKTVMGDPTTFREHFLKTWLPLTAEAALESLSTDMSAWSTLVEFYGGNVNELATIQGVEAQRRKDWIANRGDRERQERVDAQWAAKLQYMQREQDRLRKYKDKPWILERLWKGIVEGPAPSGVLGETDNQVSEPTMNFSEKDKNQ